MNFIWVKHEFEGFHKYEDAPDEVAYLRYLHHHMFKLKVYIEVFEDDQNIELYMFKNFIESCIKTENFNLKSCEMISNDLHLLIIHEYPIRDVKIELSEDGEMGCEMYYPKRYPTSKQFDGYWIGLS